MKIEKEIAIKEIKDFVEKFDDLVKDENEIENDYPQVLKYIQDGYLTFDDESNPLLELKYPIKNTDGEVAVSRISFKTRILPEELNSITKGLNIGQNQVEYGLRCMAFLTSQPKTMLNKFQKADYKTIEQICSVFL